MILSLIRKLFPPKPTVDHSYTSTLHTNRAYAVSSRKESERTLRQIEAVKEQLPTPTGYAVIDMAQGRYDPNHPIYRGKGGDQ